MKTDDFHGIAWKPMQEPALLPARSPQPPQTFFSIDWQVPLRALYYPTSPLPLRSLR